MANFLEEYAEYFKNFQEFVAKLNYEDDLLPSNLKCRTGQEELVGECVEWTLRYLRLTKCPQSLLAFLTKTALDRVKLKNDEYTQEGVLAPNMVEIVNEVCLQYCGTDNPALSTLPVPPSVPTPIVSTCAIKNSRRRMENRHAIVEDLDIIFNISTSRPTNYYGIFDGHSGVDAATYCSTHMHCFIAQSPKYPSDPEGALRDAFARTESLFTEKCNQENINGGCTALCVLHRPLDHQLYAAWVGDSQAIIVSQNKILRLVNPHKPERKDEQKRIEQAGGVVLFYGTWRVNGQLAVSRAIGDVKHKQFVSGVPEITSVTLEGDEDFLVLGCDGLWDSVKEVEVASTLYEQLQNEPGDDASGFSQSVVSLARRAGSRDNISVLVVLLRPAGRIAQGANQSANLNKQPELVAAYGRPDGAHMDILDSVDNANNPFLPTNGLRDDVGLMFDNSPGEEQGDRLQHKEAAAEDDDEEEDEDDLGPETDVDAVDDDVDDVDDVLVSPAVSDAVTNPFLEKTSLDKHEVLALAMGKELPDPSTDLSHGWLGQPTAAAELSAELSDDQPTSLEPLEPLEPLTSSQLAKGGAEDDVGGSESEDEWNYYRVEPTGDKESGPQNTDCGDSEEMESQLNPNAAVFIPSSPENSNHIEQPFNENLTQEEFFNKDNVMSSSFIAHDPVSAIDPSPVEDLNGKDEVWLSSSPKKGGVPLDNVNVPPEDEFDREVSQRPGDLDVENSLNGTNDSDSVFESVKNSKNILADISVLEPTIPLERVSPLEPTSQLEPSNPFEPTSRPEQDVFEAINSEHSTEIVVSENIESEDNCNLDTEKIAISIDVQSENQQIVFPLDAQLEGLQEIQEDHPTEPLAEGEENKGSVYEVPVSEVIEQDEYKTTNGNDNINHFDFNSEQPNNQLQTSDPSDSDLLNEVDVSNGNLHVYKPSENAYMQSPIVAGASGLSCGSASEKHTLLVPFGHGLSAVKSSDLLNEAVLYSNSGFDSMMDASRGVSPTGHISAQSTPFEGESFDFEPVGGGVPKQDDPMQQKQLDLFSEQVDEVNSHFQPENETNDFKNDLNKGFTEESKSAVEDGVLEPSPAEPIVALTVEDPLVLSNQYSTKPDVLPEENALINSEAVVPSDHDGIIEPVQSSEIFESQHVDLTYNAKVPDVCEFPKEDDVILCAEKDFVSAQTHNIAQDLVNGIGETVEIATSLSVSEFLKEDKTTLSAEKDIVPAPTHTFTQDSINGIGETTEAAASLAVSETVMEPVVESNLMPEIPVVELDVSDVVVVEPGQETVPESESVNKSAIVATVGAATIGAVAGVAAISKTDKKTTSKTPSKAKPLPATKAPIKTNPSKPTTTPATAPKKSAVPPVPAARTAPKTAAPPKSAVGPKPTTATVPRTTATAPRTAAPKPKPSEVASKVSATAKPAPPKPRVSATPRIPADKKPLTNGDASKSAAAKPLARPPTRPATAPARTSTKPTGSSTNTAPVSKAPPVTAATRSVPARKVPPTTAATKPKPVSTVSEAKLKPTTATGVAAKPRPATASSTTSAKSTSLSAKVPLSKPIDKQTKESTNKLISATRTTVSRTASKPTASKTSVSSNGTTAKSTSTTSKPQPIRKPVPATKKAVEEKSSENSTEPIANGIMKNGHSTPEEMPVQNGVSHNEPVIDKRESDLKIESLVDNQLVA